MQRDWRQGEEIQPKGAWRSSPILNRSAREMQSSTWVLLIISNPYFRYISDSESQTRKTYFWIRFKFDIEIPNGKKNIFVEDQDPRKRIEDATGKYLNKEYRVSLESLAKVKREALTSKCNSVIQYGPDSLL